MVVGKFNIQPFHKQSLLGGIFIAPRKTAFDFYAQHVNAVYDHPIGFKHTEN